MGEYNVVLLGDSLMVGTSPELKKLAPNNAYLDFNKVGMFLQTGLKWQHDHMATIEPDFLCVSLGTNDWYKNYDYFKLSVDAFRKNRHNAVIIWATIKRPIENVKYPYALWNNHLRDLAKTDKSFRVVDWVKITNEHPEYIGPDGIHATSEGYKKRASLYLAEIKKGSNY